MACITAGIEPVPDEVVPAAVALNRILAQDVTAAWDLPRFDNAAMDGFAVRAGDCRGASAERPVALRVGQPSYAGRARREPLAPGEASAVGTGAALPPGADAVVRRERTRLLDGTVEIIHDVTHGEDVRHRGEDAPRAATLLRAGTFIGPGALVTMMGAGRARVRVRRRPRAVPGLSIGADQAAGSSFATTHWYVPTLIEWLVVAGVLGFGALVFTLAVLILPMQEPEAH